MARYGAEWRSSPRKAAIPAVSLENHRNLIGSPSSATPRRRMQQLLSDGLDPAIQCKRDPFGTGCYFQYGGRTTEVREEAESWLEEDRARAISGTRHRRDRQGGYIVGPSTFTPGRRRRPPGGPNQFVQAGTGSPARRGNNSSSNGSMMMGGAGNQSRGAQPFFSPMYKRRPGSNWTATQASSPRGNSRAAGGGGAASHVSRSFAGSEGGQSGGRGSPARTLPHSRMRNTALGASHVASPARRAGGQVSSASSPYGATTVRRQRGTVGTGRSNNQPGTPGSLLKYMQKRGEQCLDNLMERVAEQQDGNGGNGSGSGGGGGGGGGVSSSMTMDSILAAAAATGPVVSNGAGDGAADESNATQLAAEATAGQVLNTPMSFPANGSVDISAIAGMGSGVRSSNRRGVLRGAAGGGGGAGAAGGRTATKKKLTLSDLKAAKTPIVDSGDGEAKGDNNAAAAAADDDDDDDDGQYNEEDDNDEQQDDYDNEQDEEEADEYRGDDGSGSEGSGNNNDDDDGRDQTDRDDDDDDDDDSGGGDEDARSLNDEELEHEMERVEHELELEMEDDDGEEGGNGQQEGDAPEDPGEGITPMSKKQLDQEVDDFEAELLASDSD